MSSVAYRRTKAAVFGTSILNEPLMTVYASVGFLLYKDLGASDLTVMALTMLKPVVAILSFYWCQRAINRSDKLKSNVTIAGIVGRIPFLFFPWIHEPWIIVACSAFFLMSYRASTPAWMEILKLNLRGERGRVYSWGAGIAFAEGAALAIAFGQLLDANPSTWRILFPVSALLGIFATLLQQRIPIPQDQLSPKTAWKISLVDPWKHSLELLKRRPDFRHFQWGIMLCGGGLMIIQAILPMFFVNTLQVTYTDLMIALHVCKGLGFALTSPLWGKKIHEVPIFSFTSIVCFSVASFPFLLLLTPWHPSLLYIAYLAYGIGQAGCRLCWTLSGTIFSEEEDSSLYTGVNIVMVGIRGLIVPPLGIALCRLAGPLLPLFIGLLACLAAAYTMRQKDSLVLCKPS